MNQKHVRPESRFRVFPARAAGRGRAGIALIALIVVLVFASIIVTSAAAFVVQSLKLNQVKAAQAKAICLARSGVCAAIVDYRGGSLWNDAAAVNVTGNQYYSVGEPVNFLLIDASAPVFRGNRTILDGINLTNVNEADDVQLASMTVSWSPAAAERLTEISFGGSAAWTGSAAGGQQLTVNCLFVHQQTQTMKLTFSTDTDLAGKTISAVFGVGGGSRRTMNLLNAGLTGNREFSIKATGQVREDVVWRRTIEATYDTGAGKITSWREIYSHLN